MEAENIARWWMTPGLPRETDLTQKADHEIHDIAPREELHSRTRSEAAEAEEMKMRTIVMGGLAVAVFWLLMRR